MDLTIMGKAAKDAAFNSLQRLQHKKTKLYQLLLMSLKLM